MENSAPPPHILQTQRTLPYTPDEIFAAFADPLRLAQWWGPNGFTNTFETFEFRTGGRWEFVMHGPDGKNFPNVNVFKEIQPGSRIVISHVLAPLFTLTVSLTPRADGTEILWVQEFENAAVADAVRRIAGPGNEQNLDRLHRVLRGESNSG